MSVADSLRRADEGGSRIFSYRVLPPRTPNFVGRQDLLGAIRALVSSDVQGARLVIYGQGGIGKSATALQFSHEQASNSAYEVVAWLDCDRPRFKDGQLARSPLAARDFADIANELAHIVKAEAALRAPDTRESLRALRARLAELRSLIIIDGFEGAFSPEGEQFLLDLPNTIDIIVTSRRQLAWPKTIEIKPWRWDGEEAREFLSDRIDHQGLLLSPTEVETALKLGRGVPLGISWIATLLARGVSEIQITDLASDGWASLLDHFFEDQWAAGFRQQGRKRAAAYLAMVGCVPARDIELVAAGSSRLSLASTAVALVDANLASREGERVTSTPFAREFIMRKVGKDEKPLEEAIDFWADSLLDRIRVSSTQQNWSSIFNSMDKFRAEIGDALEWAVGRSRPPSSFLELTEEVAYYLYSSGDWDSYLRWEGLGIQAALTSIKHRYIVEIGLVWGTRIRLHRGGYSAAKEFFDTVNATLEGMPRDEAVDQMRLVAKSVLRRPDEGDIPLARSLEESAAALLAGGEKEWACRAMLHAGNVWSELSSFDDAAEAFEWIAREIQHGGDLCHTPWENEMLSFSIASRGILANRQGKYFEAANLLREGLPGLVQTSDLASGYAEYALALSSVGDRHTARSALELCQEHKHRLNIVKTVMESRPDWDLMDGPALLEQSQELTILQRIFGSWL